MGKEKYKKCFINDEQCGPINRETGLPKIKEAHILSRSATMRQLFRTVNKNDVVIQASTNEQIGWSKASAYHCFCDEHDTKLFLPIENGNSFDIENLEQLFAHTLRSFAYEYHRRKIELNLLDKLNNLINDFDQMNDDRYDQYLFSHEVVKKELVRAYNEKDFESFIYKTYVFEGDYKFASAGTLMVDLISDNNLSIVHFEGSEKQLARPAIILTVFPDPDENRINIILSCLKNDKNAVMYLSKYEDLSTFDVRRAVSSLMLSVNSKNTFFHPDFWQSIINGPGKKLYYRELNRNRGSDLLTENVLLGEFNLFNLKM